jgi:hypothetical protein
LPKRTYFVAGSILVLCNFLKIKTSLLEKLVIYPADFQQISTLVPTLIMQDSVLERVINCSLCDLNFTTKFLELHCQIWLQS